MKKVFILFFTTVGFVNAFAQTDGLPVNGKKIAIPSTVNATTFQRNLDKATGEYYFDYITYDSSLAGLNQGVIREVNANFTDTLEFMTIYQSFPRALFTQDFVNFDEIPSASVVSLTVDTVFMQLSQFRHTSTPANVNDTIIYSLVKVNANGVVSNDITTPSNIMWRDTIIINQSLTDAPDPTTGEISVVNMAFPVNFTLPSSASGRFAFKVEYRAPIVDTMYAVAFYPAGIGSCFTLPEIGQSEFYPSAFYRVRLYNGTTPTTSITVPVVGGANDGLYIWGYDCNGDQDLNGPTENPYQVWAVVPKVTMVDNVSIDEIESLGIHLIGNRPNPATELTVVDFNLKNAANEVVLSITDFSGKQISQFNLGSQVAGLNSYSLDLSTYASGVYFYSLTVDGKKVTRKLIVE